MLIHKEPLKFWQVLTGSVSTHLRQVLCPIDSFYFNSYLSDSLSQFDCDQIKLLKSNNERAVQSKKFIFCWLEPENNTFSMCKPRVIPDFDKMVTSTRTKTHELGSTTPPRMSSSRPTSASGSPRGKPGKGRGYSASTSPSKMSTVRRHSR